MTRTQKILVSTYAAIKHFQGYQLLKNPKGGNPNEVNMIKCKRELSPDLDETFFYSRICRTFEGLFPKAKNKHLISTHIFDTENQKMTKNKNVVLYGSGVSGYLRNREDAAEEVLSGRKQLTLKTKCELGNMLDEKNDSRQYFVPKSNWDILEDILSLGYTHKIRQKMYAKKPKGAGFLTILKENLQQ